MRGPLEVGDQGHILPTGVICPSRWAVSPLKIHRPRGKYLEEQNASSFPLSITEDRTNLKGKDRGICCLAHELMNEQVYACEWSPSHSEPHC